MADLRHIEAPAVQGDLGRSPRSTGASISVDQTNHFSWPGVRKLRGTSDRVQWFLSRSAWLAGQLRDCVRSFAVAHLGRPDGVPVLDETAFLKKGAKSAGAARQYAGVTGQAENCQAMVFCAYATGTGRALIDREAYVPAVWTGDGERCRDAKIPRPRVREVVTRPELGRRMVERCRRAGVPFGWVAAGSLCGQDRKLRAALERRRILYVMAVPADETAVAPGTGTLRVDALAAGTPLVFERRSCGAGTKGERRYDWALAGVTRPGGGEDRPRRGFVHLLLVRRSISAPSRTAYFAVHARTGTPITETVRVTGLRWSVEGCFETAKSHCGLHHYEVRTWDPWHRHITLSMAAPAFLTITATRTDAAEEPPTAPTDQDDEPGTPEKGGEVMSSSAS
ncbi:IS701 family transposase [Streptomyces sp. NPDC127051]|uniref:IS701 family transposase n=1 Tax=Streptomyces sp. NPDC127051 TaxID=3347119 RepID=UPI003661E107